MEAPKPNRFHFEADLNALSSLFISEIAQMKGMIYAIAHKLAQMSAEGEGRQAEQVLEEMSDLADGLTTQLLQKMLDRLEAQKGTGSSDPSP